MEGVGTLDGAPRGEPFPWNVQRTEGEAGALRMALLVIGAIMLIPGLVVFALGVFSLFEYAGELSRLIDQLGSHGSFFMALQVISIVDAVGMTVTGLLLVAISWKPAVLSVRALLYPALVIGGVYLVFTWFMGLAMSAAYVVYLDWPSGLADLLIRPVYMLPALIGGIVLVRVGMRKSPKPRQGTQVVRSHDGSWP